MSTKSTYYPYPGRRSLLDDVTIRCGTYDAQSHNFERAFKHRTVKARRQNDRRVIRLALSEV